MQREKLKWQEANLSMQCREPLHGFVRLVSLLSALCALAAVAVVALVQPEAMAAQVVAVARLLI